ncbi:MAG: prolipoprotein diacylglyceryl transferase [Candidatus Velamenicoccus archaeovorus]
MFASISWKVSTALHIGPLMLRPHGVLIAVAFVAGARVMRRSARDAGISDEVLWRILTWALLGGLVGMRLAWDLGHLHDLRTIVDWLAVWHGGMSLLGGLIGAAIVGGLAAHRAYLRVVPLLDMAAPGLALGIAIGRLSDLMIGDHLGRPTTLPWGFEYVGSDHPLAGAPPIGTVVHPVALYDLLLTTVLLILLLRFVRSRRATGSAIALFTLWYAVGRVLTDFLRTDPRRLLGLTGSQLTSIVAIGVVTALLIRRHRRTAGHALRPRDPAMA